MTILTLSSMSADRISNLSSSKDGRVKDFKLNTQCSAGNGYFLQSTAEGFGMKVEEFADMPSPPNPCLPSAMAAQSSCSPNVNVRAGGRKRFWQDLQTCCRKTSSFTWLVFLIWPRLGSRFVLQGGTQNNLAVVKAEVDFIKSSFRANGGEPEIIVHEHCGESGAIGAAQEALRLWNNGRKTTFIGLEAVANIRYRTTRNEDTRCYFCKNNCLRTFIDVDVTGGQQPT